MAGTSGVLKEIYFPFPLDHAPGACEIFREQELRRPHCPLKLLTARSLCFALCTAFAGRGE